MKERYKDSVLGEIPKCWEIVTVKDITKDHKQGYYTKDSYSDGGIKLVRVTDLKNPKVDFAEMPYLNLSQKDYDDFKIELNDFLFARSGAIGRYGIVEKEEAPAIFGSYLIRFKFFDGMVNRFFGYFYESGLCKSQLNAIAQGNANININAENIKSLKLPYPPLPEQQKIAEILSTVDDKIDVIDQQIIETQELKKGLMQRLLTKGIGHTEFKDSSLGEIPKSWEEVKLDEHINLLSGFAFKSDHFNDKGRGTKLLRGINITVGKLRWNEKLDRWWNLPFDDFDKYSARAGDLVISMDGSLVGRNYARIKEDDLPLLIVQRVARLRAEKTLNLEYLYQIIGSPMWLNYVDEVKTSSGIPHISAKNIKDFKIPFPSINEQKQIADILSSVDDKLEVLQDKKVDYQELKKGLMQQLLTGKIRVNGLIEKEMA